MIKTFDARSHAYSWDGVRVPSVTQALEPLFNWGDVPASVLEHKRRIGAVCHAAIDLELDCGVDVSSIWPPARPYFDAWRRFRDECEYSVVLHEYLVWNDELGPALRYGGTLDAWGFLQGSPALVDWKTSWLLNFEATGSQTCAYLRALVREGVGSLSDKRFALQLGSDGRYKLERFRRLDDDWRRFVKCLRAKTGASVVAEDQHS